MRFLKFLTNKFNEENLNELLVRNYLNKSKIIEKQKKLSLTETQLFDKVLSKLIQQGFDYEDSTKILKKVISHETFNKIYEQIVLEIKLFF